MNAISPMYAIHAMRDICDIRDHCHVTP